MSDTKNIFDQFHSAAEKYGEQTAVVYLGTRYSYNRLRELAASFAAGLSEKGVKPGDRIIMYIPHGIQWVVVWLGIQKVRGVCIPITPIFTPEDLKYIAQDCHADTIVCADTNFGYVTRVLSETELKRIVIVKMSDLLPWWKRQMGRAFDIFPKGQVSLNNNSFLFRHLSRPFTKAEPDETPQPNQKVIEILYTGGTTKGPKGVPISIDLLLQQCQLTVQSLESIFSPKKNVLMCAVPIYHILGQSLCFGFLLSGGTVILHPRPTLDALFACIERFKAIFMIGVPAMYRMILEHKRLDHYDLSSVECWMSAGDVMPEEIENRFRERFGQNVYQAYGATETGGGISMCPVGFRSPPKSVGRLLPGKKVRLIDPFTMEEVEIGQPGELLVTSPHMVTEYHKKPEDTARSFIELDGETWYRTGDILSTDEDGNLFFIDRTVDTIKHKGYRISSAEVEVTLQEHPAVIEACVIGVPDEAVGERIKAFVVLKSDVKGITGYDLIKWCRGKITPYKVPQYIEFRDVLPKSKVGKLLKRDLRSEEMKRFEKTG